MIEHYLGATWDLTLYVGGPDEEQDLLDQIRVIDEREEQSLAWTICNPDTNSIGVYLDQTFADGTQPQRLGTIAHEAWHVAERILDSINEDRPSEVVGQLISQAAGVIAQHPAAGFTSED